MRSIAAALAGDHQAAAAVQLVLPETGVCSGSGRLPASELVAAGEGGGCCPLWVA